ncbi:MAG: hypothetical protein WCG98_00090 [bacterium]
MGKKKVVFSHYQEIIMTKITLQKATKEDWKTTLLLEKSAASRFFSAITKKEEIQQYMAKHDVYFITAKEKII